VSSTRRGTIVGGTWLIGLGAILLVREALGLDWGQVWPLFIVLGGVGIGISSLMAMSGRRISGWIVVSALLVPVILVGIGLLLFADTADLADTDAFGILARWWPLMLIAVGVVILVGALLPRQRGIEERISVPVAGVDRGEVFLKFGGGDLEVTRGTPGLLVEGSFEGGAIRRDLGPGRIELESDIFQVVPFVGSVHWRLGLAPDLPLSLRFEGGASRTTLDLAELRVTALTVKTGASTTRITLPRDVDRCDVRIESGAAQVAVTVPAGVAARIHSQMGLGTSVVNEQRFPRDGHGWASPDFDAAARRADISISGGVGSVRVD
jgi:hypothetical protein